MLFNSYIFGMIDNFTSQKQHQHLLIMNPFIVVMIHET